MNTTYNYHSTYLNNNIISIIQELYDHSHDKENYIKNIQPALIEGTIIGDKISTLPKRLFKYPHDHRTLSYPVCIFNDKYNNHQSYYSMQLGMLISMKENFQQACIELLQEYNKTIRNTISETINFLEEQNPHRELADYNLKIRTLLNFKPLL